jgi:hypothetical protein
MSDRPETACLDRLADDKRLQDLVIGLSDDLGRLGYPPIVGAAAIGALFLVTVRRMDSAAARPVIMAHIQALQTIVGNLLPDQGRKTGGVING